MIKLTAHNHQLQSCRPCEATALAMRLLVRTVMLMGSECLPVIHNAHIDCCPCTA